MYTQAQTAADVGLLLDLPSMVELEHEIFLHMPHYVVFSDRVGRVHAQFAENGKGPQI